MDRNAILVLCCIILVSCSFAVSSMKATSTPSTMVNGLHEASLIEKKPSDSHACRTASVSKPVTHFVPSTLNSNYKLRVATTNYNRQLLGFNLRPIIGFPKPKPRFPVPRRPKNYPDPPPPARKSYEAILPQPRHH